MDEYLDLLLAMQDGGRSTSEIAQMTGRAISQAHAELSHLQGAGFLQRSQGHSADGDLWDMTRAGRRLLAQGFEEYFKKVLAENWGADPDAAS